MPWNLNSDRPIFIQLIEKIQIDIISGRYAPRDKLPSVRELAQKASVNPNTMQKALAELERTGLVYSQRTSGRFITEDIGMIERLKTELAEEIIMEFLADMQKLGYQKKETLSLLTELIEAAVQPNLQFARKLKVHFQLLHASRIRFPDGRELKAPLNGEFQRAVEYLSNRMA